MAHAHCSHPSAPKLQVLGPYSPASIPSQISSLTGRQGTLSGDSPLHFLGFWTGVMFWSWLYPVLEVVSDGTLSSLFPSYPTCDTIGIYFFTFTSFSGYFDPPVPLYSHPGFGYPLFSRTEKLHVNLA